jgi:hypothetical protein
MGRAPAIALSYSSYDAGAYMGWSFARFWGVSNWASTLVGRLSYDPGDIKETHELMAPCNNWEDRYSPIDPANGEDIYEVRLVNNLLCRENGHKNEAGREHWAKVAAWSKAFIRTNVGYRFVRYTELADSERLMSEDTPLILDNCGVVSDEQYEAIKKFLENGGKVIMALPFGTKDAKGFPRSKPLSEELIKANYPGLTIIDNDLIDETRVKELIEKNIIVPRIRQVEGEATWAVRIRKHGDKLVMHILNRALEAIPHPDLTAAMSSGNILKDIKAVNKGEKVSYIVDISDLTDKWDNLCFMSPETGSVKREVTVEAIDNNKVKITINPKDIILYGIIQEK